MTEQNESFLTFDEMERMYRDEFGVEGKEYVQRADDGAMSVERQVTINRPIGEVYAFWRDFNNLPRFMKHLQSVTVLDGRRSHWVALAPANRTVEWDAEIVEEKVNEFLSWHSLPGADVDNLGEVRFNVSPRGTEVRVRLKYSPPGGKLAAGIATLFKEEPHSQVRDDLWRFKSLLEAGEIPTTTGQSHG